MLPCESCLRADCRDTAFDMGPLCWELGRNMLAWRISARDWHRAEGRTAARKDIYIDGRSLTIDMLLHEPSSWGSTPCAGGVPPARNAPKVGRVHTGQQGLARGVRGCT